MKVLHQLRPILLASLVVGGCVLGGALLAGFIRGVLVEQDAEYYILALAVLAGLGAIWALLHLTAR